MKKVESAALYALGASDDAVKYYLGSDYIRSIYETEYGYTINTIDGKQNYATASEMIADIEIMAEEEKRVLTEID